jgi:MOSC domain-containing protein YiiM
MSNNQGIALKLFISVKNKARELKDELILDENGILEDKFYAKNIDRSILITSKSSYELAKKHQIDVEYGSLGENIFIDINPYKLSIGTKISIGEVILEITQNCTICNSLAKINPSLPEVLKTDRGIFAKSIKHGKIKTGDIIKVLNN